jgi:hypothetical protein
MTFDQFKKAVQDVDSPEHGALLKHVKGLAKIAYKDVSRNFTNWDYNDGVFRSRYKPDKEDIESEKKGQMSKMIVPMTFSQIMTFIAFAVMSVTQNRRFFELEPTGQEDDVIQEPVELIVERDLRRNQWTAFLVQFFLDVARFGRGAAEVCWKEEYRNIRMTDTSETEGAFGVTQTTTSSNFKRLPFFVGNKIYPISPYNFLYDCRLPLTRYQEGEFCGSQDVFSYASLQSQDDLFNLDKIPKYSVEGYRNRRKWSRVDLGYETRENPNLGDTSGNSDHSSSFVTSGDVIVNKMCFDLTPKNFKNGEKAWFDETTNFPVRYIVWYANDKTIIRFEEAYYLHGMFPYVAGQYIPDQHESMHSGLADVCDQLTSLITWKINAHMASQKNSVESKFLIDPAGVDVKSLESRSPYIFLKRNASQTGVDRYIKQFKTEDTTTTTFQDIGSISDLTEKITGLSAQLQGQYSQGRRSATQDRVVAQGASSRGKTTLGAIWDTAFEPLGKQLIINNRQEMDKDTFVRILGRRDWPANPDTQQPYTIDEIFAMFKSTPEDLVQNEDFFVFDGTTPSEKAFLAQSLQELFVTILSNPQVAMAIGAGPEFIKELFAQIYLLRGVTPARLPALTPPVTPPAVTTTGAPPVPTPGTPQITALPSPAIGT